MIVTAHDHTDYGDHVAQALAADGRFSTSSLEWIARYESQLLDSAYRLNPARTPEFRAATSGDHVGRVA